MADSSPPQRIEHLLRELAPAVLGLLARRANDFAAAEDAVQEALLAAHVEWPNRGIPENPGGWLYRVAGRRLADQRDSDSARRERELATVDHDARADFAFDEEFGAHARDDTLTLLFLCCHPALTPPSAIALTLRAVGGLTTGEIARAFLVPEATMAQRISRAKSTIQDAGASFALPEPTERVARIAVVLHVLYLMFNEGYAATSGRDLVRVELTTEAIRLSRALQRNLPRHAEAAGLLALMLLTDARRLARTGPLGELVPLHEQDRSLWDRAAIDEGTALVSAALSSGSVGSYQLQAAIAALHDEAPSMSATDWPQILALYDVLLPLNDNPMVALNRAVAVAMVRGPKRGLELLDELEADARLAAGHRLEAARAHLCELSGDAHAAIRHYRSAAARTASLAERHYLTKQAARLERA